MRMELRPAVRALGARRQVLDDVRLYRARRSGTDVYVATLGVGPEIARRRTEGLLSLLERRGTKVAHVVVTGVAGGIDGVSPIGTLVVPARVIDLATSDSYSSARLGRVEPVDTMATSGRELITDAAVLSGLRARGVRALDMETAAVAAVCRDHGDIPWTAFRAISDRPDDQIVDSDVASLLHDDGRADVIGALRLIARHPRRIPDFVRLGRESALAARVAAEAAAGAITG